MSKSFLQKKLEERRSLNAFRMLKTPSQSVDFCSNDYLGIVKKNLLKINQSTAAHGSTGSRLLSGNYGLIEEAENFIAHCHNAAAGLIFNSGYDANIGLLSCVPQKEDTILYDELMHASARDGMRLSFAASHRFKHNDADDLETKLQQLRSSAKEIFVVTESVFSMDGDIAPLQLISKICNEFEAHLIVDEAHATGVIGTHGFGLVQQLTLENACFARLHTFGKACGAHGAIVLGSEDLKQYLINFSRAFIYSTSLPPASVEAIMLSYKIFPTLDNERTHLKNLIQHFKSAVHKADLSNQLKVLESDTAIQGIIVPGNENVKALALQLQNNNLDVRPILYPSVPKLSERLRIVLHSFNTTQEMEALCKALV